MAGEVFLLPFLGFVDVFTGICYNEATAFAYSGKFHFPGGRMKQTAIAVGSLIYLNSFCVLTQDFRKG